MSQKPFIIDNEGNFLVVTNLSEAICQAELFKDYEDKSNPEFTQRQKAYWSDIREKLRALENNSITNNP